MLPSGTAYLLRHDEASDYGDKQHSGRYHAGPESRAVRHGRRLFRGRWRLRAEHAEHETDVRTLAHLCGGERVVDARVCHRAFHHELQQQLHRCRGGGGGEDLGTVSQPRKRQVSSGEALTAQRDFIFAALNSVVAAAVVGAVVKPHAVELGGGVVAGWGEYEVACGGEPALGNAQEVGGDLCG